VRAGIVYVLLNFRKHLRAAPGIDPRSSGAWFDGWGEQVAPPALPAPVTRPRSWLLGGGWRRAGGPIAFRESPAAMPGSHRNRSSAKNRGCRSPPRPGTLVEGGGQRQEW
jgi:hypothetical protein